MKNTILKTFLLIILFALTDMPPLAFAEKAEDNYKLYCAQCHGLKGNGAGINKADIPTTPRDHTNSVEMARLKDSDLYLVIEQGGIATGKSTLMPPWKGVLTASEIKEMVNYLRELCKCKEP